METTGPQDDTEDQEVAKQWYDYYQAIDTHNDVIFDTEHVLQILMIKFQHFFKKSGRPQTICRISLCLPYHLYLSLGNTPIHFWKFICNVFLFTLSKHTFIRSQHLAHLLILRNTAKSCWISSNAVSGKSISSSTNVP